jgi:hypothetical protein
LFVLRIGSDLTHAYRPKKRMVGSFAETRSEAPCYTCNRNHDATDRCDIS